MVVVSLFVLSVLFPWTQRQVCNGVKKFAALYLVHKNGKHQQIKTISGESKQTLIGSKAAVVMEFTLDLSVDRENLEDALKGEWVWSLWWMMFSPALGPGITNMIPSLKR